jgi:tetratricopeptide (TPR) repeat protein
MRGHLGAYERALNLAKNVVREHPEDYYGHEYLGYIYLQMGNLIQAEQEYSLEDVRRQLARQSGVEPSATPMP